MHCVHAELHSADVLSVGRRYCMGAQYNVNKKGLRDDAPVRVLYAGHVVPGSISRLLSLSVALVAVSVDDRHEARLGMPFTSPFLQPAPIALSVRNSEYYTPGRYL